MLKTPTILIADDDDDLRSIIAARCSAMGFQVITANDGITALNLAIKHQPDVICLDVNMPHVNGLVVGEALAGDENGLGQIPVIIITAANQEETIRRCHQLSAYYIPKAGDAWSRLEPLLRELVDVVPAPVPAADPSAPADAQETLVDFVFELLGSGDSLESELEEQSDLPWVLCIDDDIDFSDVLRDRLIAHGVAVQRAFDGTTGYRTAFAQQADAIILDFNMPHGNGDYVLSRLKDSPLSRDIPVFVVTGENDRFLARRMLALGAKAVLPKPLNFPSLLQELSKEIDILPHSAGA